MNRPAIHFAWFAHQPFFVPDEEVKYRVYSSYIPLVDGLFERRIPFSICLSGALLRRISELVPFFIELLQQHIESSFLSLLGTAANHPFLPWLTNGSIAAQIEDDQSIRKKLNLKSLAVFWPPELAWSMRVGRCVAAAGYRGVVVDKRCCDLSDTPPSWSAQNGTLTPVNRRPQRANKHSRMRLNVPLAGSPQCLDVWVRQSALSDGLIAAIKNDDGAVKNAVGHFASVLEQVTDHLAVRDAPVLIGEDIERIFPESIAEFFNIIDALPGLGVAFCNAQEFQEKTLLSETSYIPAGTMEGSEGLWTSTFDDRLYRDHLERVTMQLENIMVGLKAQSAEQDFWRNELLKIQDSGFYFWPFIARSRRPFYDVLFQIEDWLSRPIKKS